MKQFLFPREGIFFDTSPIEVHVVADKSFHEKKISLSKTKDG